MIHDDRIPPALVGERLDRVVTLIAGCSRSEAARWLDDGRIELNGAILRDRSRRLVADDRVRIDAPDPVASELEPDPGVEFDVLHVDEDVIVVDKPAGLVVHPGPGHATGTLVNGLLARFPAIVDVGQPGRPGIVHRLDRGTSGLLIVAHSRQAYEALVADLAVHRVTREYRALVVGHPEPGRGIIDAPVGRSASTPTRMTITATGKAARTHYEVLERFDGPPAAALLGCELETGRTHQIRVHLSGIGHPVLGDATYGGVRGGLDVDRPLLHARALAFTHPATGDTMRFESDAPDDFVDALNRARELRRD